MLKQISSTYSQLDGWFDRSKRQPEVPQPESELFEDDKVWPRSPISEMTRLSLALSVEHLRLIRVTLDAGQLFPSAPFTTLRGALVGGAQAVWVLEPADREVRRARGLSVIAEEYDQLAKFYQEADKIEPQSIPESQWSWLHERMSSLQAIRGTGPAKLNQTQMIAAAIDTAFLSELEKRRSGRLLWRQMSADAHVLGWAIAQRARLVTAPAKGEDLAVLAAPGALEQTRDAFLCAYGLARCGWSLFDRRCEGN